MCDLLGAVLVVKSDSCREKGPVISLRNTFWVKQSVTDEAAQCCHRVRHGVSLVYNCMLQLTPNIDVSPGLFRTWGHRKIAEYLIMTGLNTKYLCERKKEWTVTALFFFFFVVFFLLLQLSLQSKGYQDYQEVHLSNTK